MENKIRNMLLDMIGDWHDIDVTLKRDGLFYYYEIFIDHKFDYTIFDDAVFINRVSEALEMIVYLYEHDVTLDTIRSRESIRKGGNKNGKTLD